MKLMHEFILSVAIISVIGNVLLGVYAYKSKRVRKTMTMDASAIMHDLTATGASMVQITRLNPDEYMLRSPKDWK